MKTGIIGDVHANLEALEAVFSALDAEGVDDVVCVGDVVGYGADPLACIERVRERCRVVVAGNHDQAAVGKMALDYFNPPARAAIVWTSEQLSDDERWWLSNLPLVHRGETFWLVHSSFDQPETFPYIFKPEDAGPSFDKQDAVLAFFGHTHWPTTFIDGDPIQYSLQSVMPVTPPTKLLVNAGSVGQPRDSDPLSSFAIYSDEPKRVQFFRTEYDVEKAGRKIVDAGLPASLALRLAVGH